MKKSVKVILGMICAVVFAALALQVKAVSLGNGERVLVYVPLFGVRPGGSAYADLMDQLVPLYGEAGVQRQYPGENTAVYDTPEYSFTYLGRSVGGGDYLSCQVTTTRTALDHQGEEAGTRRRSVYVGYDDGDFSSGERAKILWETLEEEYSDSEAYFHHFLPGD